MPGNLRHAVRWTVLVAALMIAAWRITAMVQTHRAWREKVQRDPSAADFYAAEYEVDRNEAAIAVGFGVLLFWLATPRKR
ncbi:MAG TPA: hypothetical protein VJN69_08880 [Candidatus Acidoferrales bacterium]|nr:hypothetical protein [Candidatus Acidoferrales bacterium]